MLAYAVVLGLAIVLFWLDPILDALSLARSVPELRRTPRPPINESLLALELDGLEANDDGDGDDATAACPPDAYTVHIFSKAPLVLYIENFLSTAEQSHLLAISAPLYEPSTVTSDGGGSVQRDTTVRDSAVALIPRTPVVRCIEARARALQGWRDDLWLERLRVQRYAAPSGHYGYHYDWSRSGAAGGGWGRVSSLMVFVDDGRGEAAAATGATGDASAAETVTPLRGGGTAFPRLKRRSNDARWCQFVDCDGNPFSNPDASLGTNPVDGNPEPADNTTGVVFRPVVGNAMFWENFRPDGTGRAFEETWHAGLRVEEGVKVGLNIWSWGRVD